MILKKTFAIVLLVVLCILGLSFWDGAKDGGEQNEDGAKLYQLGFSPLRDKTYRLTGSLELVDLEGALLCILPSEAGTWSDDGETFVYCKELAVWEFNPFNQTKTQLMSYDRSLLRKNFPERVIAVCEGRIYASIGGEVYCLEPSAGTVKKTTVSSGYVLEIVDDQILYHSGRGQVSALSMTSQTETVLFDTGADPVVEYRTSLFLYEDTFYYVNQIERLMKVPAAGGVPQEVFSDSAEISGKRILKALPLNEEKFFCVLRGEQNKTAACTVSWENGSVTMLTEFGAPFWKGLVGNCIAWTDGMVYAYALTDQPEWRQGRVLE